MILWLNMLTFFCRELCLIHVKDQRNFMVPLLLFVVTILAVLQWLDLKKVFLHRGTVGSAKELKHK